MNRCGATVGLLLLGAGLSACKQREVLVEFVTDTSDELENQLVSVDSEGMSDGTENDSDMVRLLPEGSQYWTTRSHLSFRVVAANLCEGLGSADKTTATAHVRPTGTLMSAHYVTDSGVSNFVTRDVNEITGEYSTFTLSACAMSMTAASAQYMVTAQMLPGGRFRLKGHDEPDHQSDWMFELNTAARADTGNPTLDEALGQIVLLNHPNGGFAVLGLLLNGDTLGGTAEVESMSADELLTTWPVHNFLAVFTDSGMFRSITSLASAMIPGAAAFTGDDNLLLVGSIPEAKAAAQAVAKFSLDGQLQWSTAEVFITSSASNVGDDDPIEDESTDVPPSDGATATVPWFPAQVFTAEDGSFYVISEFDESLQFADVDKDIHNVEGPPQRCNQCPNLSFGCNTAIARYSRQGNLMWVKQFIEDCENRIVIGRNEASYAYSYLWVTGTAYGTVSLPVNGDDEFFKLSDSSFMAAIDASGHVAGISLLPSGFVSSALTRSETGSFYALGEMRQDLYFELPAYVPGAQTDVFHKDGFSDFAVLEFRGVQLN